MKLYPDNRFGEDLFLVNEAKKYLISTTAIALIKNGSREFDESAVDTLRSQQIETGVIEANEWPRIQSYDLKVSHT